MRISKHVSGQGEFEFEGLGNVRKPVEQFKAGVKVLYSDWLRFFSPLSSRGAVAGQGGAK